jgi:hypothetical protein
MVFYGYDFSWWTPFCPNIFGNFKPSMRGIKYMNNHFCTCPAVSCDKHPANHESGCDSCIKKNLAEGEIPACFWVSIGGDLSNEKEFTVERFVDYFQRNRG